MQIRILDSLFTLTMTLGVGGGAVYATVKKHPATFQSRDVENGIKK